MRMQLAPLPVYAAVTSSTMAWQTAVPGAPLGTVQLGLNTLEAAPARHTVDMPTLALAPGWCGTELLRTGAELARELDAGAYVPMADCGDSLLPPGHPAELQRSPVSLSSAQALLLEICGQGGLFGVTLQRAQAAIPLESPKDVNDKKCAHAMFLASPAQAGRIVTGTRHLSLRLPPWPVSLVTSMPSACLVPPTPPPGIAQSLPAAR